MKKSRKLAWVVLGVVAVAVIVFVVWLSSLYTPWQADSMVFVRPGHIDPRELHYSVFRHQKYPWLPGPDFENAVMSQEEFFRTHKGTRR